MRSMFRLPQSGLALSALVKGAVLLAGAQLALADTGPQPAAGVLKLPNVRIEAASASQIAAANVPAANPSQAAARAYKDPVTGELREQTPEEMMEGGVPASKAAAPRAAPKAAITSPSGGKVYPLDETFMINSVITKAADGTTYTQCVTGHDAAVDAVLQGKAGKAHRHDR